jgi:hypothetical protein
MCACLRRPEDFEQMVDAFVAECQRQNVRYVEAHFTPYNHEKLGIGGRRSLEIVTRRLQAAEAAGGPVVRLITDIPSERAGAGLHAAVEQEANPWWRLAWGPEAGFPAQFAWFGERGRGLPTVAHAGERGPITCVAVVTSGAGSSTASARPRTTRSCAFSPSGRSAATWPSRATSA